MSNEEVIAVRVEVLEARNLFSLANHRSPTNSMALVELQVLDDVTICQKEETRIIPETATPKWKAIFDFVLPQKHIDSAIFRFQVWDRSSFGRSFMGEVALALSEFLPRQFDDAQEDWYPLESTSDKSRIQRSIKLKIGSISQEEKQHGSFKVTPEWPLNEQDWELLRKKSYTNLVDENLDEWTELRTDNQVINNVQKGKHQHQTPPYTPTSSSSSSSSLVDLPSLQDLKNLSRTLGTLKVEVIRGLNFKMDSDFFIVTTFGMTSFRTKTIKKNWEKDWNAQFLLVARETERSFLVKFSIYCLNKFGQNDLFAFGTLKLSDVLMHSHGFHVDIPLEMIKQDGHNDAAIQIRGKFTTFQEMKRNFWLHVADDYNLNDYMMSRVDLWALINGLETPLADDDELASLLGKAGMDENEEINFKEFIKISDSLEPHEDILGLILERLMSHEGSEDYVRIALSGKEGLAETNDMVVAGFLTETHARKGWLTRMVNYVANGQLDVGADNANVLVQDRETGQLIDEKMPTYIRLGIRSIYRNKFSKVKKGLDSKAVRSFLYNMTIRQGKKFNDPKSKASIKPFIEFHGISVQEMLDPIDSFKTFNEFFFRKLKPGARKLGSPDPRVAVSPADCRMMAFQSISDATRLWIKGKEFSISALLQSHELAGEYLDGSLAVFRLAPQDYHRYHSPVDGTLAPYVEIPGTYFTVNPMAIREKDVDVFTENKRMYTVIHSKEFDSVAYVIVGAMLVGSMIITSPQGSPVKRLDEIGYFAFGGSTIICLFKKGKIEFDADLLENSKKQLETLVKVGNSIGRAPS